MEITKDLANWNEELLMKNYLIILKNGFQKFEIVWHKNNYFLKCFIAQPTWKYLALARLHHEQPIIFVPVCYVSGISVSWVLNQHTYGQIEHASGLLYRYTKFKKEKYLYLSITYIFYFTKGIGYFHKSFVCIIWKL